MRSVMQLATGGRLVTVEAHQVEARLGAATHVAIVAHPDDLEFVAAPVLAEAARCTDATVLGIVCTDGAAAGLTDSQREAAIEQRAQEQADAAAVGGYDVLLLGTSSVAVRDDPETLADRLAALLVGVHARVLVTHDPFDHHRTHVAVAQATVAALRRAPSPVAQRVLGCEGWRSLQWLAPEDRVGIDMSGVVGLVGRLAACFRSQTATKAYDAAVPARWQANATFADPHAPDGTTHLAWAVDLVPACDANGPTLAEIQNALVRRAFGGRE